MGTPRNLGSNGVPYAPKIREWLVANDHIYATGDLIHFMFGSMVGFSGSALGGLNGAISGYIKSKLAAGRLVAILDNFEWPYLRNGSSNPLRVWF